MRLLLPITSAERLRLSSERGIARRWRIRERLADGAIYRTFWFTDRDEADAFLFSALTDALRYEREKWLWPTPYYEPPGIPVVYDFSGVNVLNTPNTLTQTYPVPSDWGTPNKLEAVGGGGSGSSMTGATAGAPGGGGGAYAKIINAVLPPGGSRTYFIDVQPVTVANTSTVTGATGGLVWFRIDAGTSHPALPTQGVEAVPGSGGTTPGTGARAGGQGGLAINCVGTTTTSGGNGGSSSAGATNFSAGGGGGAAGPNGNGLAGGAAPSGGFGAGGNGDAGSGGAGATVIGGTGSPGTEIGSSWGSGGGGAGRAQAGSGTAGFGGNLGAGGAGCAATNSLVNTRAGQGAMGGIIITYSSPIAFSGNFNHPLLGM